MLGHKLFTTAEITRFMVPININCRQLCDCNSKVLLPGTKIVFTRNRIDILMRIYAGKHPVTG